MQISQTPSVYCSILFKANYLYHEIASAIAPNIKWLLQRETKICCVVYLENKT
jgi:hypothetical protein